MRKIVQPVVQNQCQQQPKPKKVGRPKLPKGEAKGNIVAMRFDGDELKRRVNAVTASGCSAPVN